MIAEVGGIRQYVTLLGKEKGLVGVNAANGKFLWNYNGAPEEWPRFPRPSSREISSSPRPATAAVLPFVQLVPEGDGIKAKELYITWTAAPCKTMHGGMVLVGDKIYGGHGQNDGNPFCLDLKSGKFDLEPVRGAGTGAAGVVYADGNLYFRYKDNVMALVEATPDGYKLKSKFQLPGDLDTRLARIPSLCTAGSTFAGRIRFCATTSSRSNAKCRKRPDAAAHYPAPHGPRLAYSLFAGPSGKRQPKRGPGERFRVDLHLRSVMFQNDRDEG